MTDRSGEDWFEGCVNDRLWRLNHLYYIQTKDGSVRRFRLNWAQKELYSRLWYRNTILKARQLGMSTFTSIYILDSCLHRSNFHAGIIDRTQPDAEEKLGKIRFACSLLDKPPAHVEDDHVHDSEARRKIALHSKALARRWFMKKASGEADLEKTIPASGAKFANGSDIRIGTSLRGGTFQFLHISEFGSIAANDPKKANEIVFGCLPTVDKTGIVVMESTHEGGKYGMNYRIMKEAMEQQNRALSPLDFRFFFFPWWNQPEYVIDGEGHDPLLDDYFKTLENDGVHLSEGQKRWYCAQHKTLGFYLRQEFPSTPEEAFSQQVEGAIYGSIISRLRAQSRIGQHFEADDYAPLYVSWDIGLSDYTTMWLIQPGFDGKFYVLDYYCANDKDVPHYIKKVQEWERDYKRLVTLNLLPHDGKNRLHGFASKLAEAKFNVVTLKRIDNVWKGIFLTKDLLQHCVFHARCSEPVVVDGFEYMSGIDCLENYQTGKAFAGGQERREPLHDLTSHGADSFRYFAEGYKAGFVSQHGTIRRYDAMGPYPEEIRAVPAGKAKGVPDWW